jgi:hypothetical protein
VADLLALAAEYVRVSEQLTGIREQIRACVANGVDPNPMPLRPRKSGAKSKPPRKDMMAASAEKDTQALEAIKARAGISRAELARALQANPTTLQNRLTKLAQQGLVQRGDDGLWTSTSPPT